MLRRFATAGSCVGLLLAGSASACRNLDDDPTACGDDPSACVHDADADAVVVDTFDARVDSGVGDTGSDAADADSAADSVATDSFDSADSASDVHDAEVCSPVTICAAGKNCGTIPDGCGGTVRCGPDTCTGTGSTCGGGGIANVCGCTATTKSCPPTSVCGSTITDECGGTVTCVAPCCGDGTREGAEVCDGSDLGGATCASVVAPGWVGVPACTAACKLDSSSCAPPATTWSSLGDGSKWATFDLSTISASAKNFSGGAFDGRYVYLAPRWNGFVTRFDATATFGSSSSWTTFDATGVNARAKAFDGAAFDGRYLHLVPHTNGVQARFDTTAATFGAAGAWSTFDLTTIDGGAHGFIGAAFDGRFLYLAPTLNGTFDSVVRDDTTAAFGDPSSRTLFDVSTVNTNAKGFHGTAFDGRYVYFSPDSLPGSPSLVPNGVVARYDTSASFVTASSWSAFDVTTVSSGAKGFHGAAFDGRYVYLIPFNNGAYDGVVAQYDTSSTFGATTGWVTFDVSTVNAGAKGFTGAAFDGRYLYLVPDQDGVGSVIARYDTTALFGVASAWSTFDLTTLSPNAKGYSGAVFDGRFVYLVPGAISPGTFVARFDAKSASWEPKGWNASFL